MAGYKHNIENFIGTAKIPVGVAGPLRVNGLFAQGDYYVPLATTEAALVASYNRGAHIISEAGGASVMLLNEGVSRAPVFTFENLEDLGLFVSWTLENESEIRRVTESTTSFGKLIDLELTIEGSTVYFSSVYTTGDASGQNIVTIATYAAVLWMVENAPVKPRSVYLEAILPEIKRRPRSPCKMCAEKRSPPKSSYPKMLSGAGSILRPNVLRSITN
jgi:hydroxymethylglutaryl-CoA reductase (NADPH)